VEADVDGQGRELPDDLRRVAGDVGDDGVVAERGCCSCDRSA
jgi:hypothetical protein